MEAINFKIVELLEELDSCARMLLDSEIDYLLKEGLIIKNQKVQNLTSIQKNTFYEYSITRKGRLLM
jgi:hypothetical protein